MKDCEYYQELISRLIDRELSPEEGAELAEHAKTCEDCRRVYSAFTAISGMLADEEVEPPEELAENVMATVRRAQLRKRNAAARPRTFRIIAVAAAAALVIGAGAISLPRVLRMGSAEKKAESALYYGSAESIQAPEAAAGAYVDNGAAYASDHAFSDVTESEEAAAQPAEAPVPVPEPTSAPAAAPESAPAAAPSVAGAPKDGDRTPLSDAFNDFIAAPGADMVGKSSEDMIAEAIARAAEKESTAVTVDVTGQGRGGRISRLLTGTSGKLPSGRTADRRFLLRYDVNGVSTQVLISVFGEKVFYISLSGEESDMMLADCSWSELYDAIYG